MHDQARAQSITCHPETAGAAEARSARSAEDGRRISSCAEWGTRVCPNLRILRSFAPSSADRLLRSRGSGGLWMTNCLVGLATQSLTPGDHQSLHRRNTNPLLIAFPSPSKKRIVIACAS